MDKTDCEVTHPSGVEYTCRHMRASIVTHLLALSAFLLSHHYFGKVRAQQVLFLAIFFLTH
jgi:hypothetical protein